MAESPSAPSLHKVVNSNLARSRLIWAIKPLGLVLLVLWICHPATANKLNYTHVSLLGFVCGALYGLAIYGQNLRAHISLNHSNSRLRPNRVPDEYYWGNIVQTLFDNR